MIQYKSLHDHDERSALHEFRNLKWLMPPVANKSKKRANRNSQYFQIDQCKRKKWDDIDSLKVQISPTTPQISPDQSKWYINQWNEQNRDWVGHPIRRDSGVSPLL